MNRRKFIGNCICCAFASSGAILSNKYNIIRSKNSSDNYIIAHVEVHLAEHCNLNCKYCNHFSPIAQKEFYDLDKFRQDMDRMSYVFNTGLHELQLLGGEPLLNPGINEYVKISRKYFPNTYISIVTNGILLNDMDKSFWETLNENNIILAPTIYPIKINWASVIKKAEKYNIIIYADYESKQKFTLNSIDIFCKHNFGKMTLKENRYQNNLHDLNCEVRLDKMDMYDGKLYPCSRIAHIKHLNKKFNTNFVVTKDDYIDLYEAKDINDIKRFIEKAKTPFCKYCMYNIKGAKWETSTHHEASEWI